MKTEYINHHNFNVSDNGCVAIVIMSLAVVLCFFFAMCVRIGRLNTEEFKAAVAAGYSETTLPGSTLKAWKKD